MSRLFSVSLAAVVVGSLGIGVFAQTPAENTSAPATVVQMPAASSAPTPTSFDQVLDRIVEREHFFVAEMRHMHPLVETYIQDLRPDHDLGAVPISDHYFLGRLDMSQGTQDRAFVSPNNGLRKRMFEHLTSLYKMNFLPLGFAQMVILDDDFQKKNYNFTFVRREFIGEIRCLVIDVQPKPKTGNGRFIGRMWVEDQDYNIVRFNGTYGPDNRNSSYLHFDSWRLNMRPGVWLPAYIYSEESDVKVRMTQSLHYKAQTRLWGYDQRSFGREDEYTSIQVDSETIKDQSQTAQDASPAEAQRLWERQAEDNAVERLQKMGLLAPPGEVDKVLTTVVNNLIVTNNLEIQPDVRARVLLTTPLESFTIGHTIVVSKGLLDVLPDEASLAMVLARELGHIALGHQLDTSLAFNDRMFFSDEDTFRTFTFKRSMKDEEEADQKALELLDKSPYKDKLGNAGLFLKALQSRSPDLKNLIDARLGDGLVSGKTLRMSALLNSAPQLDERKKDQIAALPLGGRVRVDPWSNQTELAKTKPVALVSAREKMPFEVTPVFPYLTRISTANTEKVASTAPAAK